MRVVTSAGDHRGDRDRPSGVTRRCGRRARALAALFLLAAGLTLADRGAAHPHVFVDHSLVILLDRDELVGIELSWVYDELTSSMLLQTFDTNRDRTLSPVETATLGQKYLDTLRQESYFVDVRVDGKPWKIRGARDLRARVDGDRLVLAFTLPLGVRLQATGTVEIRVDDPTYFVAFALQPKGALQVRADARYAVTCRVVSDPKAEDFETVRCAYRRKAP